MYTQIHNNDRLFRHALGVIGHREAEWVKALKTKTASFFFQTKTAV